MKNLIYFLLLSTFSVGAQTEAITYHLDPGHTYIGFDVERFLVGEVSGRFNESEATVTMSDNDLTSLQVEATIKTESLDSNNDIRDGHLKGEMWLDATAHPAIHFKSTAVRQEGESYVMTGDFTIKGITNTVEFPIEILGPYKDPTQHITIGLRAAFSIDRFDYGIQFNKTMDNGELFIGREVKIKIRALAIQQ